MKTDDLKKAFDKIAASGNIAILTHVDADGDALGTAYGLKLVIEQMGAATGAPKAVRVITEEIEPHKLMPVVCDSETDGENNTDYDLVIAVDSSDLGRLGTRAELYLAAGENTICFDHHKTCTRFGAINYVDVEAGACGEVIYEFCRLYGVEITPEIANNLYLAISSDTGGFRQANATPRSLEIAADLIRKGANSAKINTLLFVSNTIERTRLVGEVLCGLKFSKNTGVSLITVSPEQMSKHNCTSSDIEGLVNFARNILGVKIAIYLRKKDDGSIKASLRSNSDIYDVSEFCARFGGGGHLRAAGCEFPTETDLQAVGEIIVREAEDYIRSRDYLSK
ncbi:MAG: bifunctional oligoribonuclease/PAP phosphatase NrnA [Clostridiales bacterium]|jgi:phosphoesterase RecJ-like protein|nr:bifunctional oligoribonuclease/PAP phosphatase NrnA [Clostridiales bacterium]